jgi:redox-sensitive bicupin YhaK (pirin superfamily)
MKRGGGLGEPATIHYGSQYGPLLQGGSRDFDDRAPSIHQFFESFDAKFCAFLFSLSSIPCFPKEAAMLEIRRSSERGYANHGWLKSFHTFSFADYFDPNHIEFGALRVINEDRVAPGAGFGTHGHRDMEIISYVLEGELAHKDSTGTSSTIRPGDVQRMSAGSGVRHSEFNPSAANPVHFLQIWIQPNVAGIEPSYEEKRFSADEKRGRLRLIASPDQAEGSVLIHQNARVYAGLFDGEEQGTLNLGSNRQAYVHVARGKVTVNGTKLETGDGLKVQDTEALTIENGENAEVLVFDLPADRTLS